jgi:hypothetical protein
MLVRDIVTEGASSVLYHYTSIQDALRIMASGAFQLSSITGNKSEEQYAPPGYPYFFSTTRTRTGDYHRYVGTGGVLFVLDGRWFNQRYPVKPVDYWERSWIHSDGTRTRESEDRVFSKQSTIPADGIREIHVLLKEQDENRSPAARKLLIAGKTAGIETHLYTNEKAWRLLDKRNSISITRDTEVLQGPEPQRITRPGRSYLEQWLELIYKKNRDELGDRAKKLRHDLIYYGSRYPKEDQNLGVDLSNGRKPSAGPDRVHAVKIIDYMRSNGYKTTADLKNAMVSKWSDL